MNDIWVLQKVSMSSGNTIAFYLFDEKPSRDVLRDSLLLDDDCITGLLETAKGRDYEYHTWYLSTRKINKGVLR